MTLILNLESSTQVCSVSLSKNGQLVDYIESNEGQNHARLLSVFADQLIQRNKLDFNQLQAVAISKGPGSYTGLRIGVSLAKGICYANQIPLIAISPLQAMSDHVSSNLEKYAIQPHAQLRLCPMIDARRMEVYTAMYDLQNQELESVSAKIVDADTFASQLNQHPIAFFGNGASKCQPVIDHPNAIFINNLETSAQFMCSLAQKAFDNNHFEDVAYFEPFYLKDFIAGIPKKNMLKP
ncbi:tRNA (adenosine(37)-N6)-threonylcarbamoyltransferase complex dimerization subunit type 1 TsaB [uncultured Sunxiuqinia sp.]|uniref:tRNA (adenosine(37)-N6)-threonylcarbamoyltransferase complex dimerization subunit type 1 TsaB n=1 Tax=uncultured Sunxiuqinia sp. TaxID=1573825 RepID=UPI00260235FF|nr:tRNA (adenosine(37)-N6)-threonylcarbamoyltransferase complex dimerization subunit type 1 TsaB [uncultured Sunxiuqinia sp.]